MASFNSVSSLFLLVNAPSASSSSLSFRLVVIWWVLSTSLSVRNVEKCGVASSCDSFGVFIKVLNSLLNTSCSSFPLCDSEGGRFPCTRGAIIFVSILGSSIGMPVKCALVATIKFGSFSCLNDW